MIDVDMEMRERLKNYYENSIQMKREQYQREREQRIKEEKEQIKEIQENEKKEKNDLIQNKRYITQLQYDELKRVQELNKIKTLKSYEQRMIPQKVSLDIESDNNLYKIRNYIFTQSDKIDHNVDNYCRYQLSPPPPKHNFHKEQGFISPLVGRRQYISDVLGKPKTDVSDRFISDKYSNPEYFDYVKKNKEYKDFNENLIYEKGKSKTINYYDTIKQEREEYDKKTNFGMREKENKEKEEAMKKEYKSILDDQRKNKIISKLANENLTVNDVNIYPQYYKKMETELDKRTQRYYTVNVPGETFLNKNHYVEVNPYCKKQYNLGNSFLQHNPIINPVINYKYNRYMFPNDHCEYSPFQNVGSSISNMNNNI